MDRDVRCHAKRPLGRDLQRKRCTARCPTAACAAQRLRSTRRRGLRYASACHADWPQPAASGKPGGATSPCGQGPADLAGSVARSSAILGPARPVASTGRVGSRASDRRGQGWRPAPPDVGDGTAGTEQALSGELSRRPNWANGRRRGSSSPVGRKGRRRSARCLDVRPRDRPAAAVGPCNAGSFVGSYCLPR